MKPYLLLVVIVVAAGLGVLVGLGGATVLAALPAMFCLMAAFGGTLHADLRLLAWFGPLLVLVVGGLKALGSVTQWPAIALVTLIVFGAGLLPVLGPRYITVGMGLGMASTFGYGFQLTGPTTVAQDFAAPALSVGVVLAARVLLGVRDPDGPLRDALAAALTDHGVPARERAVQLWRADGPRGWTTGALGGTLRYHNAVQVINTRRHLLAAPSAVEIDEVLAQGAAEATRLAEAIRAGAASDPADRVRRRSPRTGLPGATRELVTSMWLGLEAVQAATADRDRARVDLPSYLQRGELLTSLRGALSWQSVQLRHAVRCAVGMLVALSVSLLWASNPLRLSFLMAAFAIMQPQLQDTIQKARQRIVGALAGAAVLAMLIVLVQVPQSAFVPIGVGAVLVGFLFFMQTQPIVFNACIVLMSVGLNVNMRHMQLRQTLLEYLLLIALAVLIALVFGFVAVPGVRRPSLTSRFDEAVGDVRNLLREVAAALVNHPAPDRRALRPWFRAAARAHQNLRAGDSVGPGPTPEQQQAAEQASEALAGLSTTATALLLRARGSVALAAAVGETAQQLGRGLPPDPAKVNDRLPAVIDSEQRLLVDTMITNTLAVFRASTALR